MFNVKPGFGAGVGAVAAVVLAAGPAAAASGWTVVSVPPARQSAILSSVSAASDSNAWAVGHTVNSGGYPGPLADHWNGTSWQQTTVPNNGSSINKISLSAVSAATTTDAWTVGISYTQQQYQHPLAYHWDGRSWTQISTNTDGASFSGQLGVADIGTGNAWAVGYGLEHWNGTSWSVMPAPPAAPAALTGVTSSSSSSVWAVGGSAILFWNGTSWTTVSGADPSSSSVLYGVSTRPGAAPTWAVGANFVSGSGFTPFVLENG